MTLFKNRSWRISAPDFVSILFVFALTLGLSACGGGGGDDDSPDPSPNGLFKSGTASLNAGAISITDMRAFVYGNRIIMFSIAEHLLFDGSISTSDNDFTATVRLYDGGEVDAQGDIGVSGTFVEASSISGTLAGSGKAQGTFTLTFDTAYSTGATLEKIRDKTENFEGHVLTTFSSSNDLNGIMDAVDVFNVNELVGSIENNFIGSGRIACGFLGEVAIPGNSTNIYSVDYDIPSDSFNGTFCPVDYVDPSIEYSGFAAVLSESNPDNDILFAATNGTYSFFGLLSVGP